MGETSNEVGGGGTRENVFLILLSPDLMSKTYPGLPLLSILRTRLPISTKTRPDSLVPGTGCALAGIHQCSHVHTLTPPLENMVSFPFCCSSPSFLPLSHA